MPRRVAALPSRHLTAFTIRDYDRPVRSLGRPKELHVVLRWAFRAALIVQNPRRRNEMTRTVLAVLAVLLVAAAPSSAVGARDAQDPSLDSYIVVLKPDAARSAAAPPSQQPLVAAVAQELGRAHGGAVTSVYQYALKGFAVQLSADAGRRPRQRSPRRLRRGRPGLSASIATQSPATWGLDRIDQRDLPLNNTYNYNQTGQGVHAYIIDTGIRATHQEFAGRIGNGFTAVNDGQRHERLQRARHPRGRHDGRHDLRRRQAGHAPRRARAQLLGLGLERRASSPAWTGSRRTTPSPPWRT